MTPQETLKLTTKYLKNLEKAKDNVVKVGLPKEKVGSKVYGGGLSVIANGIQHEFALGNNPQRSFLRVPFIVKQAQIVGTINNQFKLVLEKGKPAEKALGIIGADATNIVKGAFTTQGYGKWKKSKKPSGQTLIQTGILRNSNTWVIARAT